MFTKDKKMKNIDQDLELTADEILQLELKLNYRLRYKLELEKKDLMLQNIQLQNELYTLKIAELDQTKTNVQTKKIDSFKQYMSADKDYKDYVKVLESKYNIDKKNWGYNPDTGKLFLMSNGGLRHVKEVYFCKRTR